MSKSKALSLTLCPRCKSNFEDSGRKLIKLPRQAEKDNCDICQVRKGWEYRITEKNGRV